MNLVSFIKLRVSMLKFATCPFQLKHHGHPVPWRSQHSSPLKEVGGDQACFSRGLGFDQHNVNGVTDRQHGACISHLACFTCRTKHKLISLLSEEWDQKLKSNVLSILLEKTELLGTSISNSTLSSPCK